MGIKEEIREKKEQIRKVTLPKDELIKKYLDGEPYDLTKIAIEVKHYYKKGIEASIEIGKRLLVVKEIEGEGKFSEWLRNNFAFSERTAYNLIGVIKEISPEVVKTFSQHGISKSKLYSIKRLPKEELNKLEETGSLIEVPLEEIKDMTARQWQNTVNKFLAKINKQQEQIEAGNKQLQEMEQKIQQMNKRDAEANPIVIAYSNMTTMVRELLNNEEITEADWKDSEVMRKAFDMQHTNLFARFNTDYEPVDPDEIEKKLRRKGNGKGISA